MTRKTRAAWACWSALLAFSPTGVASVAPGVASPFVADQPGAVVPAAVDAEVLLIHATNDADAGVDPRVGKIPKLGEYKSYKVLSRTNVSLKKSAPTATSLPNGRTLQISLKDVKDGRFVIDTSINQPGGSTFLPLLEVRASVDVPVYIAGQSYQGGMLIIAIKILPH